MRPRKKEVVDKANTCSLCLVTSLAPRTRRSPYCSRCYHKGQKIEAATRGEHYRREDSLKRVYGLTMQDYNKKYADQKGTCAICALPTPKTKIAVDHNHRSGQVRGLLCHPCNRGLGQFKDNFEVVLRAAKYLCYTDGVL